MSETTIQAATHYQGAELYVPTYPEGRIPSLESLEDEIALRLSLIPAPEFDIWGGTSEAQVETATSLITSTEFVTAAHDGRLTKTQTERWACCAGRESRIFPQILACLRGDASNPVVREIYDDNLNDELGFRRDEATGLLVQDPNEAHFQHYLQLLTKLGIDRKVFDTYSEGPDIRFALDLAMAVATESQRHPDAAGKRSAAFITLGYTASNEGFTPEAYDAAATGFHHFFEADEHQAAKVKAAKTGFVDEHTKVDIHHVAELHRAIAAENPNTPQDRSDLLHGVRLGVIGMRSVLTEAYQEPRLTRAA